jgi:integrase
MSVDLSPPSTRNRRRDPVDSQQRRRIRIDTGIYKDRWGLSASVKVGSGPTARTKEERFPFDTPLKTMKAWQDETRVALRKLHPTIGRGTFAADVTRYLAGRTSMPTYKERAAHLALWAAEFGTRNRHTIETVEIDTVLSRWLDDGRLAPSSVKNRRTALMALWTGLDGKRALNPVREALMPSVPDPEPRAVSYATIRKILAALPDVGQGRKGEDRADASKTKARLAVIAYTGLPHKLVKQLTPASINWRAKTVTVAKRRKGKGAVGRTLPLTADGLAALRQFADLDCWGPFSNSSMGKSWQRACKVAKVQPAPRVYDLRHSFGTEMYRQTGDVKVTSELLVHAPGSIVVHRYTGGGVAARLHLAVKAFNAAMGAPKAGSTGWQYNRKRKKTA